MFYGLLKRFFCELTLSVDLFGWVAESSYDRKLKGAEFHSTNLAADVCLAKMLAGFYRTQNDSFMPPKIIGFHFALFRKFSSGALLTKMPSELLSTEQIFTELVAAITFQQILQICGHQSVSRKLPSKITHAQEMKPPARRDNDL